ncbi:MAG TPA: hypothetical protein V6C81_15375 [Planktothrix sp.]
MTNEATENSQLEEQPSKKAKRSRKPAQPTAPEAAPSCAQAQPTVIPQQANGRPEQAQALSQQSVALPQQSVEPYDSEQTPEESGPGSIDLPLEFPRDHMLFIVPAADARTTHLAMRKKFREWIYECELDDYLKAVVFNTNVTLNVMPNAEVDEFYRIIEEGMLPESVQARCFRAEMIMHLTADGDEQLTFFAPFWTTMIAGHFHMMDLDAVLIDFYDSPAYPANLPFWQFQSQGVPLTHNFLGVTGNTNEATGKLSMHTTGMRRFGLPELQVNEVNPAFGQDVAYFLRGLGQYMWSTIEKLIPATTTLSLTEELDFPSSFCELDKFTARSLPGTLLPCSLNYVDPDLKPSILVEPTMEFDTEDQWFNHIVQTLRKDKYLLQG